MAEQDEDKQDRRGLIKLLALKQKGRADAEQITGPDAEQDEHGHVEDAVPQCPHRRHGERPGRIENGRARQEKQRKVESQKSRRRKKRPIHTHGGQRENGDREDQTDDKPITHVTGHRRHVHPTAVAHLMRGLICHRLRSSSVGFLVRVAIRVGMRILRHDVGMQFADMARHRRSPAAESAAGDHFPERRRRNQVLVEIDRNGFGRRVRRGAENAGCPQ